MTKSVAWSDWAFVLWNPDAPIEKSTGHFTTAREGTGMALTFHPWDIDRKSFDERIQAVDKHPESNCGLVAEDRQEPFRKLGENMAKRLNEAVMEAVFA